MSSPEAPSLAAVLAEAVTANPGWSQPDEALLLEEARFGYGSPGEAIVQANFVLNNYVHYWSAEA